MKIKSNIIRVLSLLLINSTQAVTVGINLKKRSRLDQTTGSPQIGELFWNDPISGDLFVGTAFSCRDQRLLFTAGHNGGQNASFFRYGPSMSEAFPDDSDDLRGRVSGHEVLSQRVTLTSYSSGGSNTATNPEDLQVLHRYGNHENVSPLGFFPIDQISSQAFAPSVDKTISGYPGDPFEEGFLHQTKIHEPFKYWSWFPYDLWRDPLVMKVTGLESAKGTSGGPLFANHENANHAFGIVIGLHGKEDEPSTSTNFVCFSPTLWRMSSVALDIYGNYEPKKFVKNRAQSFSVGFGQSKNFDFKFDAANWVCRKASLTMKVSNVTSSCSACSVAWMLATLEKRSRLGSWLAVANSKVVVVSSSQSVDFDLPDISRLTSGGGEWRVNLKNVSPWYVPGGAAEGDPITIYAEDLTLTVNENLYNLDLNKLGSKRRLSFTSPRSDFDTKWDHDETYTGDLGSGFDLDFSSYGKHGVTSSSKFNIDRSYDFNGSTVFTMDSIESLQNKGFLKSDPSKENATFELWFKPESNRSIEQVLFETGGIQDGMTLSLGKDILSGGTRRSTIYLTVRLDGKIYSTEFTTPKVSTNDFNYLLAVVQKISNTKMRLILRLNATDAVNLQDKTITANSFDWCGSDRSGLGGVNGQSARTGSIGKFRGEIAEFNVWSRAISREETIDRYFEKVK